MRARPAARQTAISPTDNDAWGFSGHSMLCAYGNSTAPTPGPTTRSEAYVQITERSMLAIFVLPVNAMAI
jgi:hypothetical protein